MQQKKRILICPLDWGLGHATRCIPIIQLLLKKNITVLLAGSGRSLELLKKEFPELEVITLPGYDIRYSRRFMAIKMAFSIPKILKGIRKEHQALKKIIDTYKIDLVISDNRYGLWSDQVKTVFITHQLYIKTIAGTHLLRRLNLNYIKRFTECWVPDEAGTANLSGDLSHAHPLPGNAFFIGSLSRFNAGITSGVVSVPLKKKYNLMVIISGPEPQRSIFEELILKQLQALPLIALVVKGMTELEQNLETKNNLDVVSYLNTSEMKQAILSADLIIARSGYSTIMDLAALGKKAVFIPTPGQTEQEYLAYICMQKKIAYSQPQHVCDLKLALKKSEAYNGFECFGKNELEKRVTLLLEN